MSAPVQIGVTDTGERMMLDTERLVGAHTCVMANAGAGKSGLMRVVFEAVAGRMQTIILDPEDEFYTLRQLQPDLLIAGGEGGDCPATPENAAVLATMLLTHGLSAVIQLNSLRAHEQERFVALFLDSMMAAPQKLWHPVLIGLDEAHRFAPQDGDAASGAAVKDVASRGRKRGFTLLLASQRMAKIDKNVTGDVNNWFMGRVGQATDRRVACEQLGFSPSSAEGRALQSLPTRRFYAMGVALTPVATLFDVRQARTTILQAGGSKAPTPPPAAAMAGLLKELTAASKAPDAPTDAAPVLATEEREAVFRRGVEAGRAEGREAGVAEGRQLGLRDAMVAISRLQEGEPPAITTHAEPAAAPPPPVTPPAPRPRAAPTASASDEAPSVPAASLLASFARAAPRPISWVQAAVLAGRRPLGGSFNSARAQMQRQGWVEQQGAGVVLTEAGRALVDPGLAVDDPLAMWRATYNAMPGPVGELFGYIADNPRRTAREMADALGRKPFGGSWNSALSLIRKSELVQEEDGRFSLVPWLQ